MPRPLKQVVDYFPHMVNHGKTILVLRNEFGNDGYAFWFSLLELLCKSEGQYYDYNTPAAWRLLLAETHVKEETAKQILEILAEIDAIDKELSQNKIIWVQKLVDNLDQVYDRRTTGKPSKPVNVDIKPVNVDINPAGIKNSTKKVPTNALKVLGITTTEKNSNPVNANNNPSQKGINANINKVTDNNNPASIVEETILNKTKQEEGPTTDLKKMFFSFGNDPKYSGVDFDNEYQKFCEYWLEGPRKLTRKKLACHNWLDKCLEYAKEKSSAEKKGEYHGANVAYKPQPPGTSAPPKFIDGDAEVAPQTN